MLQLSESLIDNRYIWEDINYMNVNIYYGGRGLVDDPTIVVINRIQEVLEELNVHVTRYNLYEIKNTITTLSQSVVEADGVVFATTTPARRGLWAKWPGASASAQAGCTRCPAPNGASARRHGWRNAVSGMCGNGWRNRICRLRIWRCGPGTPIKARSPAPCSA